MNDYTELRKWLLTTFLSLAVAAFSWSSAQMFGGGHEQFERFDRLHREEMIPATRQLTRSVEVLTVLAESRKSRIAGLDRNTSSHRRFVKLLADHHATLDSPSVQRLCDSARIMNLRAATSARLDSASYAAMRLRRLAEPDLALLRAAEALKHAEAIDWTQQARYWTVMATGKSISTDSDYVAAENSLEIAERGFDEAMAQGEKSRAEDEEEFKAIDARVAREVDDEQSRFRKLEITYGVSAVILLIAFSIIFQKAPKKTLAD